MAKAQTEILASTVDMSHQEWLEMRTKGIGGSDASIVLGLNKYKTAFELWLDKTGQSTVEDSAGEAAYFGNLLEDVVAKEFELRTGKKVRKHNFMLKHPKHDFIIANIDRKVVGENALLECKTASAYLSEAWEGDEIPDAYLVQVQHYLGVTGFDKAYIAVLIGGQRFVWKEIDRDEELIKMIFSAEVDFWNRHVIANIPPALDGSSAAEQYLKERFEKSDPNKTVDLAFEYKDKIGTWNALKSKIKELDQRKKEIENDIKQELGEAEIGFVENYQATWKQINSNRVDTKRLKTEFPEVYDKVLKQSSYRKFDVKEIG
ncbi:YqaJ viral recombinase family nuclease [Paraliobacillus ryukyuensis]|uniref:YqaJ viral recombinase family nuclease n=1 Tax=Paraliobacillus ryukyuensis TaxID=200904 RepID=UPI0021182BA2|nr:YqaJ viral recombinase family protein [Paraliobacillus ryukyuensis]